MSDFIPFDIQKDIIQRVTDVNSLIRFRSVSNRWKSFIDSPQFIAGYGAQNTHPPRFIVRYVDDVDHVYDYMEKYICFVDDNDTSKQQLDFPPTTVFSPLVEKLRCSEVIGTSHGFWCVHGYNYSKIKMVVIWNPSIRKSVGIPVLSSGYFHFGFGVCPVNNDPTILKILSHPWHVEVFTLSSGVWSLIPRSNLPRESIRLELSTPIVIDRFIYWVASEMIVAADWPVTYMIILFDLITRKFKEVTLPVSLENQFRHDISISKLRDSLILFGDRSNEVNKSVCVRVMIHDGVITSFTKLFTIDKRGLLVKKILGFRKSGEPIMETQMQGERFAALEVYEPCSQDTEDLEIYGDGGSFFMGSCKETLLLLHHSDGYIYLNN